MKKPYIVAILFLLLVVGSPELSIRDKVNILIAGCLVDFNNNGIIEMQQQSENLILPIKDCLKINGAPGIAINENLLRQSKRLTLALNSSTSLNSSNSSPLIENSSSQSYSSHSSYASQQDKSDYAFSNSSLSSQSSFSFSNPSSLPNNSNLTFLSQGGEIKGSTIIPPSLQRALDDLKIGKGRKYKWRKGNICHDISDTADSELTEYGIETSFTRTNSLCCKYSKAAETWVDWRSLGGHAVIDNHPSERNVIFLEPQTGKAIQSDGPDSGTDTKTLSHSEAKQLTNILNQPLNTLNDISKFRKELCNFMNKEAEMIANDETDEFIYRCWTAYTMYESRNQAIKQLGKKIFPGL